MQASPEELALIQRCQIGDARAQATVYNQYARAMYNTALRLCRHEEDARDVLQEAFLQVFRQMHTFRNESTLGAWIKRIVINHGINAVKRRRLNLVEQDEANLKADESQDNTDDAYKTWQVEQVRQAIQQLSDGYRTVFSLYLMEGYDHKEISDILGISEATSKSQYSRARQRVREWIEQQKYHE